MAPRVLAGVVAAVALAATVGASGGAAPRPAAGDGDSSAYGWPVRPFDEAHSIRSNFGDPRTLFDGPPTPATLYRGSGSFSLHTGIDVVARDGAAVYPVRSGVVASTAGAKVIVRSPGGTTFQYWHIVPTVARGEGVAAYTTVLGRVRRAYGHVHLVELHDGRPANPLARGHLTPYDDETTPRIERIQFRRPGSSEELLPELVRGDVEVVAPVSDLPCPAGPGEWATTPVAPALVTWRVERTVDHRVALPERVAFDVRDHLPQDASFWSVYARGTRQNMATFRKHRYWHQPGLLLFRLGTLDSRRLRNGFYTVVVTAADVRGNTVTARAPFLVYNGDRWPPETMQQ